MAQEIEAIQEKLNWHWRNSMRTVRFFSFDGRAALPLPVLFFYFRVITLVLFAANLLFFQYLERKGLSFPAALRSFRLWILGKDRPGWLSIQRRRFKDFG